VAKIIKEEIKVPAKEKNLVELRNFINTLFKKHRIDEKVTYAFKLVVDEAATNVVKHGHSGNEGIITLRAFIRKESITILLIDNGKYFDPMRVQNPDLQRYVDTRKRGGLGIFTIRKLMDSIDYRRTEEGNELRLTKMRVRRKNRLAMSVPQLSMTMKARYSLVASGILTVIILIVFLYYYFRHSATIIQENLELGYISAESLAKTLTNDIEDEGLFNDLTMVPKISQKKIEFDKLIYAILVVQPTNDIYFSTDEHFSGKYNFRETIEVIKNNVHLVQIRPDLIVYDINAPINDLDGKLVGLIHLWIDQNYIERLISSKRWSDLVNSLFAMIGGYIVIVIFVYMVMTPFQRLTEWVRAQGQGGEIQDQIDITDSGEIGEIAKAFSDITTKFKDSQKKLVRQEQLQKEMQVAKEIQQTLLPTEFPKLESYGIDAYYEAAKEVGGDYFDFVNVDDDTLGIVVADVSGKGIPGSLVMTMIRTALRTEARGILNSSEVLGKVNSFVVNDMKKGMFVTVFYAIIDARKRRINFCCAGHNPMILYRGSTKKTYFLKPHGFPIGISLPDMSLFAQSLEMDSFQLVEDDILIFYTDGITEAMNRKRQMYGEERLLQIIRENANLPVQSLVQQIKDDVHSFTEGFPQSDDITLVVIKEESTAERQELKRAISAHRLIMAGKSIRAACEQAGITTYAYYNKYKQKFESEGIENIEPQDELAMLEAKHLSIEEKTKIFDIIRVHVDYGPRRISEELDTEKYGFTKIPEAKIYDELVRSRLNTRQLREAFFQRNKKAKRVKPPGTPFLTLDGEVIIDKAPAFESPVEEEVAPEPVETAVAKNQPTADSSAEVVGEGDAFLGPLENFLEKTGAEIDEKKPARRPPIRSKVPHIPVEETGADEESRPVIQDEPLKSKLPPEPVENENAHLAENELHLDEPQLAVDEMLDKNEMFFHHGEFENEEAERAGQDSEFAENIVDASQRPVMESENQAEKDHQTEFNIEPVHLVEELSFSAVDEILQQESPWNGNNSTLYEEIAETAHEETERTSEIYEQDISSQSGQRPEINSPAGEKSEKYTEVLTQLDEEISALVENQPVDTESEELYDFEYENSPEEDVSGPGRDPAYQIPEDSSSGINVEISYKKLLLKGLSYYRKGAYDQAIDTLNIITTRYPELKEAHIILGNAYFRNRMFEQAATEYYKVKALDPENLDAYENMGVIYANSGEYKKAIEEWQHILKLNPRRYDIRKNIERAVSLIS